MRVRTPKQQAVRLQKKIRRYLRDPRRLVETDDPNPLDPTRKVERAVGKRTPPVGYVPEEVVS